MRSLVLVLALAQPISTPPQTDTVVERGRAGPVAIGASAESVYDRFRERAKLVDLKLEGMLSPALELRLFGAQTTMIAEIGAANNRLVITRISVVDPSVRTKDGIGVGSTYDELRARYRVDWVGSGEGGYYARVESLGISFQLDSSRRQNLSEVRDPNAVPPDVRVLSLLLTR